ncbi:Fe2+-dependent dioxygenase [Pseudomarimonas salicorniae]|uniref:Fe2+-dependent dioxygenase n=1 Tax=Pseudomarimonas salicorniae TaxID=2933270 RepID=A0ABT0GGU7_9GAMM|nr:Fe2+-dependent dioxygenase [Lysobacter sp. CAU 1642]MCK7593771.1 Fe2+-dependent dioxygenase [Lysobacter sp. CAU 1642]
MQLLITDLFTPPEREALHEAVAASDFADGRRTAGRLAAPVKRNEQAEVSAALQAVLERVGQALMKHPMVRSAARPKRVVRVMANRYGEGMTYGDHVDDAFMAGERCDVSFTYMLSPRADYAGGELVISGDDADHTHSLEAGELLLYPADTVHRVEPVSRGARLAIVGWLRSWVADPRQRAMLFDLDRAIDTIAASATERSAVLRLQRIRGQLLRMWGA